MKRTPFYDIHCSLGAKIVPFAGFEMPIQYTSIIDEHRAVRTGVGVFDVSHMGEIVVRGSNAFQFLQRMTINDVSKLYPGRVQYSALCYEHGGIVDDILVYCFDENNYLLVVNAANTEKDYEWLVSHKQGDVLIENHSDEYAMLAVQGPKSLETVQRLTNIDLMKLPYYHSTHGEVAGESMIISRTGYTGEVGVELYFASDHTTAQNVWNALFDAGREFGIVPVGLGARDTLRLEMGYCLYGQDIDETTNPLEAGLQWITKLSKDDFIGKEALVTIQQQGVARKLVGFVLPDKRIARHGYQIFDGASSVGYVTSGGFSPTLQKSIGLGYVSVAALSAHVPLEVDIRGTRVAMSVTQYPFYRK